MDDKLNCGIPFPANSPRIGTISMPDSERAVELNPALLIGSGTLVVKRDGKTYEMEVLVNRVNCHADVDEMILDPGDNRYSLPAPIPVKQVCIEFDGRVFL